jgi:hypothetical protein
MKKSRTGNGIYFDTAGFVHKNAGLYQKMMHKTQTLRISKTQIATFIPQIYAFFSHLPGKAPRRKKATIVTDNDLFCF